MTRLSKLLAATAMIAVSAAGPVFATPLNTTPVTASFAIFQLYCISSCSAVTGSLNLASGLAAPTVANTTSLSTVGESVTFAPTLISFTSSTPIVFTWGSYTFTSSTETESFNPGQNSEQATWTGLFHDSTLGGYQDQAASLSITVNSNGTETVTGNFSTPIPEPVSLSILGLGIAGVAAVRRRRMAV